MPFFSRLRRTGFLATSEFSIQIPCGPSGITSRRVVTWKTSPSVSIPGFFIGTCLTAWGILRSGIRTASDPNGDPAAGPSKPVAGGHGRLSGIVVSPDADDTRSPEWTHDGHRRGS